MKGIKIFGVLAIASLLFSTNAFAQENNNRDENGKVVRGAYETNRVFDNTWIGIGAGINSVIPAIQTPGKWGKIGLGLDLNFGKWWTPAVGMRIGYHGLWNKAKIEMQANPEVVAAGDRFGFHYFHADVLWNCSHSFAGYNELRFWNFAPYLSMGVLNTTASLNPFGKGNLEYAAGPGLLNILRLSKRINLTIDLRLLVGKGKAYNPIEENMLGRFFFFPSATAGLAFNLGKTNFDRHSSITPVVIPVPFTTEQYNALKDKVAALEKENAELKDKVAALENELAPYRNLQNGQTYLYENGTFTAIDVKPGAPITVYFNCDSHKISAREKAHIEYFAQNVVNGDTKLSVNGYADKQTGSAKYNQTLSERRVKAVIDLLKTYGANEANIESAAHGSSIQPFEGMVKNRVVTVEVK